MKVALALLLPVSLLVPESLLAQTGGPPAVWTIPGVANVAGQNGTHFVSDVAVTNPGTSLAVAIVSFLPDATYPSSPVLLQPGQTMVWRNVLQQLWGASTSGALRIASDGVPLLIRARTYNDAASGTFGVALPVYTDDGFLLEGDAAESLWVSQSPDPAKGYRTNVAVLFPDPEGGAATVTVFDGNGSQIGQTTYSLGTAGVQQISVSKFASAADVARATLEVTSGRAAGYSAVVDNTTGDSSLFTFDDLPAGPQNELINGVARANGKNGTFFRTDGRFYNPGTQDVTVSAFFHANGSSNPSPASGSVVVPAGKIVDVTDVLGSVLGQAVGASGAVRFTAPGPVGILCRTSNVDPTGADPGTFGAQQKPVPVLSFLTSADAGALITGVRQSADPATGYRTNIAVAAGPDGATAQLTLKTSAGATAGSATVTLGAWGWQQTAADKLFGTAIPDDAEVLVRLTQGSADFFDSSVDNRSGDSVVTPTPALPLSIPTSATLGSAGGSIRSADGRLTLKIPAGALASSASYAIATTTNGAPGGVGSGYRISDPGLPLSHPARIVFRYGRGDTNGSAPGELGIAWQSGSSWYTTSTESVDTLAGAVTMDVPSLQPAAGLAPGGRTTFASSEVFYDPYIALGIVGPGMVLQADARNYTVDQVVRVPENQGYLRLAPEAQLQNFSYTWSVEPSGLGGSVIGTVSPFGFGNQATYAAPGCPPNGRITLQVGVVDTGTGGPIGYMTKSIRVLWKDWKFTISENANPLCQFGIAFSSASQIEVDFSLDRDGFATGVRTIGASSSNGVSTCGPVVNNCSATQTNPEPIQVANFTASYDAGSDRVVFSTDWLHMGGTSITFHCTGLSPPPVVPIPGTPDSFSNDPVPPFAGGVLPGSDPVSSWSAEVRPLKGSCP